MQKQTKNTKASIEFRLSHPKIIIFYFAAAPLYVSWLPILEIKM